MTEPIKLRPAAPQLPATTEEMLAQRIGSASRTLNDHVEDIHVQLYKDEEYQKYLEAVWDEEAVEGSISMDEAKACEKIRAFARTNEIAVVANKNLATIRRALLVVLRRYKMSRTLRRKMINGVVVPDDEE